MAKLWGGRFKKKTDADFERFSASFKFDRRLLPYDLQINEAYVQALQKCGVLRRNEAVSLLKALSALKKKSWPWTESFLASHEDVHSFIQSELAKKSGVLADKIHTGRSRNDLVAQSSRLYCKDQALKTAALVSAVQKKLVIRAERYADTFVPGMTHLQSAQVLSQAHIFLAYAEMLERSREALALAVKFSDVCVLGSGALAGSTFSLDQKLIAGKLGLSQITRNSYDVSGDRDYILQFLNALSLVGIHLSRMAEDLMIAQTKGFETLDIDESLCTGSSMMPQKKNADFVELARGSAGIFLANFMGLASTLKGLPTSYNRDLQWDKKYLFDSVETAQELLAIFAKLIQGLEVNRANTERFLQDESLYATDLADYLVRKGVPFKKAHGQVGQIVSFAEEQGLPISKIGLDLLKRFAPELDGEVYALFDAKHSVSLKKTIGSTNPSRVRAEIQNWKRRR